MGIRKFTLVSINAGYRPEPLPGEEVEQKLTVDDTGKVWFSGYDYEGGYHDKPLRSLQLTISEKSKGRIFSALEFFMDGKLMKETDNIVIDAGHWELAITDTEGREHKYYGSLVSDSVLDLEGKKYPINRILKRNIAVSGLFGFEG
ncbi:MAG: hypothetical protein VZT48_06535 [Bulleidia sp.]|nr:hypothetical protein [Bulleidia sp.]